MHRHSRSNRSSKKRSATLLVVLVIAVCSLLAVHPVLKARTNSLLGPAKQKAKLQAQPDDSQNARERAQQLGLVPTGKFPLNKYDLVSAMPSDQTHLPVVKGSRSWRKVCYKDANQSSNRYTAKDPASTASTAITYSCCHCRASVQSFLRTPSQLQQFKLRRHKTMRPGYTTLMMLPPDRFTRETPELLWHRFWPTKSLETRTSGCCMVTMTHSSSWMELCALPRTSTLNCLGSSQVIRTP